MILNIGYGYVDGYGYGDNTKALLMTRGIAEMTRLGLALVSANWFDHPADKMTMIGVTGTNGKTTTTYLLKHVLEQCVNAKVGLVGTIQRKPGIAADIPAGLAGSRGCATRPGRSGRSFAAAPPQRQDCASTLARSKRRRR